MDPVTKVLFWWLAFGGTHTVLTHPPIRSALVGALGDRGFQGVYSLISFATFVPLMWVFFANRESHAVALSTLVATPGIWWLTMILMLLAVVMLVLGFAQPSPLSLGGARAPTGAIGVLRITRHPAFMAFGILGLAHLLVTSNAIDRVFFGGLVIYTLIGCAHQDWRKRQGADEKAQRFFAETSYLPFAAIASGRNRLDLGELGGKALLLGLVVFAVIFVFHHRIFG